MVCCGIRLNTQAVFYNKCNYGFLMSQTEGHSKQVILMFYYISLPSSGLHDEGEFQKSVRLRAALK